MPSPFVDVYVNLSGSVPPFPATVFSVTSTIPQDIYDTWAGGGVHFPAAIGSIASFTGDAFIQWRRLDGTTLAGFGTHFSDINFNFAFPGGFPGIIGIDFPQTIITDLLSNQTVGNVPFTGLNFAWCAHPVSGQSTLDIGILYSQGVVPLVQQSRSRVQMIG